jgi:OFA family oxalate/formate antiporter-like MFS transporter
MSRFFYGWWVLLGLCLVYGSSNGILMFTLPLFYPDLISEFGWNEAEVTRPAGVFLFVAAVLHPLGGVLLDRYSARILMFVAYGIAVVALGIFPYINSLGAMMIIHGFFGLSFGLAGLVANMLVLTRWFVRYRGIAVGLLLMGASFGGAVFPLIVRQPLIDGGWREASGLLAVLGGLLMLLPLIFMVRNRPQDLGLHPDGAQQNTPPSTDPAAVMNVVNGPSLRDALGSRVFYMLAFATATLWFCIVGVYQHQAIYLGRDLGVDKADIPFIFSVFFWSVMAGKAGFGYLSDRLNKVHVMLGSIINLTIGLIVLRMVDAESTALIFTYAVIYGMGVGGAFAMIQLVIADYFAGNAYGKILGIFTFVDTMAGSLGALVLGSMRVAMDSYVPAMNLMIGMCTIAAGCVIVLILSANRVDPVASQSGA